MTYYYKTPDCGIVKKVYCFSKKSDMKRFVMQMFPDNCPAMGDSDIYARHGELTEINCHQAKKLLENGWKRG